MSNEIIDVEFKSKSPAVKRFLPLVLTFVVILMDQITKLIIEKTFAPGEYKSIIGDLLNFTRVYNKGAAWSIGSTEGDVFRFVSLCIVPLIVLLIVLGVFIRNKSFTGFQRWSIAGIMGGGFGNLIDRFFRESGVVDFIDVKFFKIPYISASGRWPTFNVADMAVVICGILLIISFIITIKKDSKEKNND